jgi:hypothetical protein
MNAFAARPRALTLILVAALALAVAPTSPAHASGVGSAAFTITLEGAPVAASEVTLSGSEFRFGYTDSAGQTSFSDLALGDYTLWMGSTPAHQSATVTFSLTADSPHHEQVIALIPWPTGTGSISGTVVDSATREPMAGVLVSAGNFDSGQHLEGLTDESGHFEITGLVAGTYAVAISSSPGYFSAFAHLNLGEGEAANVDFALLAADSAISGRVVDQEGNGVPGLWLGAYPIEGTPADPTSGQQTDADGYYTMTGAGAGTWLVRVDASSTWERAEVVVDVEAASTATAPDLVVVPRFTGSAASLVRSADGIPEAEIGGFFDVCVTALHLDGTPATESPVVTGGDSFFHFVLAPGEYTAYFEDCDDDREPHGYQATYLGGSTTLPEATTFTVETNVDVWLDTTYLQPQSSLPEPTHDATPVRTHDLEQADEDLIDAPSAARRGEAVEVAVGTEYAGQWVSAWLHPHATQLGGWHQVSPEGTIEITVPSHHPVGLTDLVVQDADDDVIGWTELRVLQRLK